MKAVILAGGRGKRLLPYTTVFPKPLMPIGHRPVLDIIIQQLAGYGFHDIVLSVGYLAELIQAYFENSNGRNYDVRLTYIRENRPMGTAGSLRLIPGLTETFMVMNGDVLTSLDYSDLVAWHHKKQAVLTIATCRKTVNVDLGVIETTSDGTLLAYHEKPRQAYTVSMGIYVYEPAVLQFIEPGVYLDFPELVLRLLERGQRVVAYPFDGYWLDIGREEDYLRARQQFHQLEDVFLPAGVCA